MTAVSFYLVIILIAMPSVLQVVLFLRMLILSARLGWKEGNEARDDYKY